MLYCGLWGCTVNNSGTDANKKSPYSLYTFIYRTMGYTIGLLIVRFIILFLNALFPKNEESLQRDGVAPL